MKKQNRDSKFELLRIISMIMIICHHATYHSATLSPVIHTNFIYSLLISGGKLGVAIFIMITGYFLIDKKIDYKKLIKLELQVLFYSIILYFSISSIAGYTYNQKEMVNAFIPNITKIYWFYSGYFIITILSPYLSKLLNNMTKLEYLKLLLILFILLIVFPNIRLEMINEIVLMLYYFIIGGFIKKYAPDYKKYSKLFLPISIICYLLMASSIMYLSNFTINGLNIFPTQYYIYLGSPLVFLSSCSLFLFFSYQNIKYSKIINKLGSISFAVYLIHDHFTVRSYLWNDLLKVTNPSNITKSLTTIIISIILIYLFTLIIETIRIFIFDNLEKLLIKIIPDKKLKKERRKRKCLNTI